jgi:hypothetical protein
VAGNAAGDQHALAQQALHKPQGNLWSVNYTINKSLCLCLSNSENSEMA